MQFETVSIVGLGYIGLPTAAVFASRKIKVIGVDINQDTVDTINKGGVHIIEPDLDMLVHAAVTEGYLKATIIPEPSDAFLLAVPTPFKGGEHEPDLSYIEAATNMIAPVLKAGNLVVLESTSPVGATEQMADWLSKARPDLTFPQTHGEDSDIRIAHCPERVLPGHVLRELVQNDRVIGGMTEKCSKEAVSLYKTFVEGTCVVTNSRTAEMAKLTENSFRDVNIAFANELSMICDKLNINVWELIELANRHPRVNILQPGPGVGGHCIAVDPWFIVNKTPKEAALIKVAREVNDSKPEWVTRKVSQLVEIERKANPDKIVPVICYGLTFKPNIDDLRESPSLEIAKALQQNKNILLSAVEPNVDQIEVNLQLINLDIALNTNAIHVLCVDHDEFRSVMPPEYGYTIDLKGIWNGK